VLIYFKGCCFCKNFVHLCIILVLFCPVVVKIKVLPTNGPFPDPKDFTSVPGTLKKCVYNGRVRALTTWIGSSESDIHICECVNKTYDLLISFFYTHVRATYFVFKITTMNRRSTRFSLFFLLS